MSGIVFRSVEALLHDFSPLVWDVFSSANIIVVLSSIQRERPLNVLRICQLSCITPIPVLLCCTFSNSKFVYICDKCDMYIFEDFS